MQDLPKTGGDRNSTPRWCTDNFLYPGTQNKAVTPQELGLDLPEGCGESPGELAVAQWWDKETEGRAPPPRMKLKL